jgi:hypothetical protein
VKMGVLDFIFLSPCIDFYGIHSCPILYFRARYCQGQELLAIATPAVQEITPKFQTLPCDAGFRK